MKLKTVRKDCSCCCQCRLMVSTSSADMRRLSSLYLGCSEEYKAPLKVTNTVIKHSKLE